MLVSEVSLWIQVVGYTVRIGEGCCSGGLFAAFGTEA